MNKSEATTSSWPDRQLTIRILAMVAGFLLMMAVMLAAMGRRWWCACGSLSPASWDIWSSHNSQHLIDPYFFSHFLHGILFFGFLQIFARYTSETARLLLAVAIEVGWELLENSPLIINRYREATISLDYFGDSIANSLVDVGGCLLGYWVTARIGWWTVPLFLLIELVMLWTIRDNLTLNVLMLAWPIEAIKQWQSPV